MIEKSFISLGYAPDRVQCYNCLKYRGNFLACAECTDVMFCSKEYRNKNSIHKTFCSETINRMPLKIRYEAESLLLGIIEFSNANEMMSFVEETLAKRFVQVPHEFKDSRSKYGLFLSLKPTKVALNYDDIYKIYTALLDIAFIKNMFRTENSQRFLMHLVAEHWAITCNNSFQLNVRGGCLAKRLGVVMSLFNHSCAPNLLNRAVRDHLNTTVFITQRLVKKGEQLFITYDLDSTQLLQNYHFYCKYDKCVPHCEPSVHSTMKGDSNFQFLVSLPDQQLQHESSIVKDKCEAFLRKFGHFPWSNEMEFVLKMYDKV